ncbi:MAG TPA: hypothetical protein VLT47_13190 [Anaeromyxobacteraceae bacterium]|nr:hypothetical protein [Anaeromyxobacteraceae bacterium]
MRRWLAAALAAAAGCATPTWPDHLAGAARPNDRVILVGSFVTVPPITQRGVRTPTGPSASGEPQGGVVFVGKMAGNAAAVFTADLSEPWRADTMGFPVSRYDWAWFPMGGYFFVEVPRVSRIFLRGVLYQTDAGSSRFELPAAIDLAPGDEIVYVGELRVVRTGERRTLYNDRLAEARQAAEAAGHRNLLAARWRTSLPRPVDAPRVPGWSR